MIIYRIEHPTTGNGPYVGNSFNYDSAALEYEGIFPSASEYDLIFQNDFSNHLGQKHSIGNYNNTHPGVRKDVRNFDSSEDVCGFNSEDQYREWFRGLYTVLGTLGYHLCIYSVDDTYVKPGRRQIAFNKSKSTLIATRKLGIPYGKRHEIFEPVQ